MGPMMNINAPSAEWLDDDRLDKRVSLFLSHNVTGGEIAWCSWFPKFPWRRSLTLMNTFDYNIRVCVSRWRSYGIHWFYCMCRNFQKRYSTILRVRLSQCSWALNVSSTRAQKLSKHCYQWALYWFKLRSWIMNNFFFFLFQQDIAEGNFLHRIGFGQSMENLHIKLWNKTKGTQMHREF